MKHILLVIFLLVNIGISSTVCTAWDGFDADTADLVEIIPDKIPKAGTTVEVVNHDKDSTETCLVESVVRNRRTIEIVVRDASGATRTFVMEGR